MSKKIADIATKLVTLLEPLESPDRRRAVDAALVILGDTPNGQSSPKAETPAKGANESKLIDGWPAHTKFRTWMKQHNVSQQQLEELYHVEDGKVSVIASKAPGAKTGEKARTSYLLQGIAGLIETGEPAFLDEAARGLCTHLGCYDKDNHSIYLRALGNQVTGSKKSGWKLTSPGLAAAAAAIKDVTGNSED